MKRVWHEKAWEEYLYWQTQDKKTLKKINHLLENINRNGYNCIGKPEPMKGGICLVIGVQELTSKIG